MPSLGDEVCAEGLDAPSCRDVEGRFPLTVHVTHVVETPDGFVLHRFDEDWAGALPEQHSRRAVL